MRLVVALAIVGTPALAFACPEDADVSTDASPATTSSCLSRIDLSVVGRTLELGYTLAIGGVTHSGLGQLASASGGIDLLYGVAFGGTAEQPAYSFAVNGGVEAQQVAGDDTATGLVTRAGLQLGPARVTASVVDEGLGNMAVFPLTMELAHTGELAARPRLSARPELARARYGRERLELATRLVRVEGAGVLESKLEPGAKDTAWAVDVFPLHAGVDLTLQDGTRLESTVGGALLGIVEHTTGASVELLGIESKRIAPPMQDATDLTTLWVLSVEGVNPATGSRYFMGWGEVVEMPDGQELGDRLDPENGQITIGGFGWFKNYSWGGFGAQYKREPFTKMTGAVALEDRISAEVHVPVKVKLTARVFAARTTEIVDGELDHESSSGLELGATYARKGYVGKLDVELGRTFYTALDDSLPSSAGFAASAGLTLQRSGKRSWRR